MADTEVLNVEKRDQYGSRNTKRLRNAGQVPAILYGHGKEPVGLSVPSFEVESMLRHGSRVVDLKGGVNESAFVKAVQWDSLGSEVLHLDFTRVSKDELVETTVAIDLRGDAPGTKVGGILQHMLHEIEISCPAHSIPERLEANVNALELGESITVADLNVPAEITIKNEPTEVVVQCVEAAEEFEEEAPTDGAEPEVIGRSEADDDE